MSKRYLGGVITANPATPTGPFQTGTAPGMWTTSQQLQYAAGGVWPIAGLVPNYIENMFSTYLYTGNGDTQTITNGIDLVGKGGLVWVKQREQANENWLTDTARGANKQLISNQTGSQYSFTNVVTGFNSNGFDTGSGINAPASTSLWASWTFRKQPKFFDVVTYTGDGSAQTINHNLGSVPGCIIIKTTSTSDVWRVYHRSIGNQYVLALNTTTGQIGPSAAHWNNTNPTSTQFTVGTNGSQASVSYVAYLYAHNAGGFGLSGSENVISCGSYTGVTYPNSLEVTLGFEPQWVLIKNATTAAGWAMWDVMRGMSVVPAANTAQALLLEPNTSAAESNQPGIYPTPTGFVVKNGLTSISGTGDTITYIAIRRGPMAVPTLGTSVFGVQNNASTTFKTFGFPVDWSIFSGVLSSSFAGYNQSRLTDGKYLLTNSTSAQQTTDFRFQSNTGVFDPGTYNLSFRRAPGFFDVVCYTGTGVAGTFNHNLAAVPELMIVKGRTTPTIASVLNWVVYPNSPTQYLYLNAIEPSNAAGDSWWNNTAPTSSVFSLGTGFQGNEPGTSYVAYLFATCPGVSKVGSYTGTGTTLDINCGFTAGARFVLVKKTSGAGSWYVWDSARGMVSGTDPSIQLNATSAEINGNSIFTSSTGFQVVANPAVDVNSTGESYIFLAIS